MIAMAEILENKAHSLYSAPVRSYYDSSCIAMGVAIETRLTACRVLLGKETISGSVPDDKGGEYPKRSRGCTWPEGRVHLYTS